MRPAQERATAAMAGHVDPPERPSFGAPTIAARKSFDTSRLWLQRARRDGLALGGAPCDGLVMARLAVADPPWWQAGEVRASTPTLLLAIRLRKTFRYHDL